MSDKKKTAITELIEGVQSRINQLKKYIDDSSSLDEHFNHDRQIKIDTLEVVKENMIHARDTIEREQIEEAIEYGLMQIPMNQSIKFQAKQYFTKTFGNGE